ncbi:MAG: MBL fold metallo-hydrolase [Chloroflexi bacterium]|nr:MBL fold metallo-hydrolase [Chloroflexota bacterium]
MISRIRHFIQGSTKISPDIYQITVMGANIILIAEEKLTLIDTGYRNTSLHIIESIHQLGRSPEDIGLIIITHNHIDHVGGLAELKPLTSAKVAIHRTDIGQRKNLPSARDQDIDIRLEGGDVFDVLGGLEVIHTPGHTPGSICLFSRQNKLLIVGDALRKRRNVIHIPHKTLSFDLTQAVESARKLAQLDCDTICFGHGLPLTGGIHSKMQDLVARITEGV